MIEKIAWNTFKKTGSINAFMEYKKITNIQEFIKEESYEISKSKGNSNSRENSIRF